MKIAQIQMTVTGDKSTDNYENGDDDHCCAVFDDARCNRRTKGVGRIIRSQRSSHKQTRKKQ